MGRIAEFGSSLGLNRVPVFGLAACVCALLAFQHLAWLSSPTSELAQKNAELRAAEASLEAQKNRLRGADDFLKNLDAQRERLRVLTAALNQNRAQMKHSFEADELLRWIAVETAALHVQIGATRIGMESAVERDYASLPIKITLRGTYGQLIAFLGRVESSPTTLRVGQFSARPLGATTTRIVPLDWTIDLTAYRLLD